MRHRSLSLAPSSQAAKHLLQSTCKPHHPPSLRRSYVTFLTPDIATIIYQATESPTGNRATMSGNVNATTVWVRPNIHGHMHLHTEYALPPAARP